MKIEKAGAGWNTISKVAGHQEGMEWILQGGGLFGGFHKRRISATRTDRCKRHNHVPTQVERFASWYESPSTCPL